MMSDSGRHYISIEELISSVIILDGKGRIREINRAALDLLEYDKKALLNKPMRKVCKDFSLVGIMEKIPIRDYEMEYRVRSADRVATLSIFISGWQQNNRRKKENNKHCLSDNYTGDGFFCSCRQIYSYAYRHYYF